MSSLYHIDLFHTRGNYKESLFFTQRLRSGNMEVKLEKLNLYILVSRLISQLRDRHQLKLNPLE